MPNTRFNIETLWRKAEFSPNKNQREAILYPSGPLYLPAGPGSGKTRVLLWRALNLIVFQNVSPDEIFLATFTEKAAYQLKEGLRSLLGYATNITGKPYDLGRMYVGTIHSLCQKLIVDRRFSSNRYRRIKPVLLDELSQYFYVSRIQRWGKLVDEIGFGDALDEISVAINSFVNKRIASKHEAVVNSISLFNRFSEELVHPEQFGDRGLDDKLFGLLTMYSRYKESLLQDDNIPQTDFSLLQQEAYNYIKSFDGKGNFFKHVIIDEYQDTNTIQEKLVFELAKSTKNICVVGDDDQALYRFRGATVENFVNFPENCRKILKQDPCIIPLDTNYRSRESIVKFYSDFMIACDWLNPKNKNAFFRVPKEIKAKRRDKEPAVVVSSPGRPDDVCAEIAVLVKKLLKSGIVENENQIAFLFPSLKTDQVTRFKNELEKLNLKVYAPRAGKFIEVEEAVSMFGMFLHILGTPTRGFYPGKDYNDYFDWIDNAFNKVKSIINKDKKLAKFIDDRKKEVESAICDYQALLSTITNQGWQLEQPYDITAMEHLLSRTQGLSSICLRNILSPYFRSVVKGRENGKRPILLQYALTRATSIDWTVQDLFYRLCSFTPFKEMFDLAESGDDEGPICNMSLISQYLAKFMDEFNPLITAASLQDNKFQRLLFGSYLYALFRLGESEYEDAEDPFPKGRIPFLTIHQAKGLEFPVVVFGNPRKQVKVQKIEIIVQPLLSRKSEPLDRMPQFDLMRLFYVALSRAENLLIIPEWKSKNNYVSKPLNQFLDNSHIVRIPSFDINTVPKASLDKQELSKNYSYTSDYLLYQKCPRQYMIFRKYGFVPSRSQTMFFGSLVHQTLEDLHQYLISQRERSYEN
jgi:DNA helicase II / ATP-dependent DNA helicase PcrA